MKHIKIINNLNDSKNLIAKSLIYDNINKENIHWLQQPNQGESFNITENDNYNLILDSNMPKISITYHNIDSSLKYNLGFGDNPSILNPALNGKRINKYALTKFVFENNGDNVLDIYINKDPNKESIDIHWNDVSPEIDPVTVHINKYISNIPKLSTNIKDVICDAPIIKIEPETFKKTNIESFECDGIIEYIGNNAFRQCEKLKSIELKNVSQYIGEAAFFSCRSLTKITLPNNLTSLGSYVFSWCSSLKGELTLPNSLTSIGSFAFQGCTNITIYVPETIETIGNGAFKNVKKVVLKNYTRFSNWQSWGAAEIVEE